MTKLIYRSKTNLKEETKSESKVGMTRKEFFDSIGLNSDDYELMEDLV